MATIHGIPVIELREKKLKTGFLYEALKDGEVIATRKSVRQYEAAIVMENNKRIANGVGRMDLLPGALNQYAPGKPDYVALKIGPANP